MKKLIKELNIQNLYGKNYYLNFNDDLTIFYGRNGSGKTTLLNIIQLIFEGEIKKVCGYSFDSLVMKIIINKVENKLVIYRNDKDYTIIFNDTKVQLKKINSSLSAIYQYGEIEREELESSGNIYYNNYFNNKLKNMNLLSMNEEDEEKGNKINNYLKKELDFIYIPLNRKVKTSNREPKRVLGISSNKKNIEDSLKIAESYFGDFKNYINRMENATNLRMKTQIFNQLSRPIDYDDIGDFNKINQLSFKGLEVRLGEFLGQEIKDNIEELLKKFSKTKRSYEILDNQIKILNVKDFISHTFSVVQLNKLKNVIEATETKNQTLTNFKNSFEEVIENINNLFEETGKMIGFNTRSQKLYFSNINESNKKLDLALLSSGEKQLVIFFIFSLIDYKRKNNSILLIDEPEVSLHIEWQERLLPSILKNNNKKQIVIATHSPDIIGDYVDKCIEIKGV